MKLFVFKKEPRHLSIGKAGEDISVKHLVKQGYKILERNYRKKCGEIDIIAKKKKTLHFIEVKSVSCVTRFEQNFPEENIRSFKKQRLTRAINTYLAEKKVTHETDFQVDVMAIYCNPETKESKIRMIENVLI